MGAFIGYGETGVWANNHERDAFLDWYADHRCVTHDAKWEYCKSEAQRWMGRCIDLNELIPQGDSFDVSADEIRAAEKDFWPNVAKLLTIIRDISQGHWMHTVSSKEAVSWRDA